MPHSLETVLHTGGTVTFTNDVGTPEDLHHQAFRVHATKTLILNDFYFNQTVFTTYELQNETGTVIRLTPFCFEDDDQEKLRLTRALTASEIQALFPQNDLASLFRPVGNPTEAETINIEHAPASVKDWLGRAYYLDLKERGVATATYVDHDPKQKKNFNPEWLLSNHSHQQYTLFQGDYALYFLEAKLDAPEPLLATLFLDAYSIEIERT